MNPAQTVQTPVRHDVSLLSEQDLYLFNEGSNYRIYEKMGGRLTKAGGVEGTCFSVWAPSAQHVYVLGSFNGWNRESHPLQPRGSSGIWEGFIAGVGKGSLYKFFVVSHNHGHRAEKADPLGLMMEQPPRTASVVWDLEYTWNDEAWMQNRGAKNSQHTPISTYELHMG